MVKPFPRSVVGAFTRRGVYSVHYRKTSPWKNCGANGIVAGNNPVVNVDPDGRQTVGISGRVEASTSGPAVQGGLEFTLLFDFSRLSNNEFPLLFQTSTDVGGALSTGGGDVAFGVKFSPISPDLGPYMAPKVNIGAAGGVGVGGSLSQDVLPSVELLILLGAQAYVGGAMEAGYVGDVRELYPIFMNMLNPTAPYIDPNSSQAAVGSSSGAESSSSGK